jgi:uncharacterized membrane protein
MICYAVDICMQNASILTRNNHAKCVDIFVHKSSSAKKATAQTKGINTIIVIKIYEIKSDYISLSVTLIDFISYMRAKSTQSIIEWIYMYISQSINQLIRPNDIIQTYNNILRIHLSYWYDRSSISINTKVIYKEQA